MSMNDYRVYRPKSPPSWSPKVAPTPEYVYNPWAFRDERKGDAAALQQQQPTVDTQLEQKTDVKKKKTKKEKEKEQRGVGTLWKFVVDLDKKDIINPNPNANPNPASKKEKKIIISLNYFNSCESNKIIEVMEKEFPGFIHLETVGHNSQSKAQLAYYTASTIYKIKKWLALTIGEYGFGPDDFFIKVYKSKIDINKLSNSKYFYVCE